MTNLKKKILTLLISMLSIFLFILIFIFNIIIYNKEYKDVENKLKIITNVRDRFNFNINDNRNPIFMDNDIYEVLFDKFGNINKIISYANNELSEKEIINLININAKTIRKNEIGSLYRSRFIFKINKLGNLIILDNLNVKKYLESTLNKSVIIFVLLDILIVLLSLKITNWIVQPVVDTFKKQKQFIDDASHELKTPIAIIGASAETLEKNPEEKKWIENIISENDRMNKLVSNLLNLSKSENIKENEIYSEVNLSKVIESKILSFESLIYENSLKLDIDIQKNIMFKCNADRIKELLSILVDNAIKHGFKNSKITVNLYSEKNSIILSVKNRGEEIPIEERKKIFERFYRIDKSRNRNESRYGLGLSIAKNIALNHRGDIFVNCVDGYTIFTVKFKQN